MTALCKSMAMAAILFLTVPAFANEAHHPGNTADAPPPATAQKPKDTGAGKMTTGAMIVDGPTSNGMGMMSDEMMKMMMEMMAGGDSPMGQMMSPEHVEGRIAFLSTELKLTETQRPLWDAVAEALRANAHAAKGIMSGTPAGMMMSVHSETGTPVERIALQEKMPSTRLEALHRLKAASEPFYALLNDEQKKLADKLLVPTPMGMM